MSQLEKLWEQIKNNPKTVTFDDLDKLLTRAGFSKRNRGTSHYVYKKNGKRLTIPKKQPYVEAEYVEQAIEALRGETV